MLGEPLVATEIIDSTDFFHLVSFARSKYVNCFNCINIILQDHSNFDHD